MERGKKKKKKATENAFNKFGPALYFSATPQT